MEAEDLLAKLIEWLRDEGWTDMEIIIYMAQKLASTTAAREAKP